MVPFELIGAYEVLLLWAFRSLLLARNVQWTGGTVSKPLAKALGMAIELRDVVTLT